jgi:multiple sugar transport system permease protein
MAHSLRRIKWLKGLFRTLLILPWIAPLVVSGLIWRWLFDKDMGLINYLLLVTRLIQRSIPFLSASNSAMVSGIIASSWCYIPFLLVLIMAGLESVPEELYEAARMDGANNLQQFWHISLALNRSQMIIAYLVVLMFTFRTPDTFFSLTAGGPAKATYHTGIFLMETIYRYLNFGHAAAISVIVLLICFGFAFPGLYFGILRRSGK